MIVIRKSEYVDTPRTVDGSSRMSDLLKGLPTSSPHSTPVAVPPERSRSPPLPTSTVHNKSPLIASTGAAHSSSSAVPPLELNSLSRPGLQKTTSFDSVESLKGSKLSNSSGYASSHGSVRVVIGHVGDCRAVLSDSGNAVELTTDHHPCMPSERARVEAAGGVIRGGRVNGVLAVTRSIGDIMHKQFDMNLPVPDIPLDESNDGGIWAKSQHVISKPDVVDFLVQPTHEFIVLASDGKYEFYLVFDNYIC